MNKQTENALRLAQKYLRECDDHNPEATESGAEAIQAIEEALKGKKETSPILVFVRGGCVTLIADENGEAIGEACIIDYDNAENGQCPVCGGELYTEGQPTFDPCDTCGYDETKDNGIESAVKYHRK